MAVDAGGGFGAVRPEAVGEEESEAGEALPVGGGGGEAVVEAGVEDEVGAEGVAEGEEGSDGVAAGDREAGAGGGDEGLGDVPELGGELEVVAEELGEEVVGDGEGLVELGAADGGGGGAGRGCGVLLGYAVLLR